MQLSGNLSDSVRKLEHNALSHFVYFRVETQASYKKFRGKLKFASIPSKCIVIGFKRAMILKELSSVTD